MTKLQFKFRGDSTSAARHRVIASLESEGADKVEPIFPGDSDEELATLYSALVDERLVASLLRRLKRSRAIEFAEPEVERTLIRPRELKTNTKPAA